MPAPACRVARSLLRSALATLPAAMPELSVATFNTHWGVGRRGRPYDVVEACRRLEADVIVLQESWRADGTPGLAAEAGAALGYEVHQLPLGRGDVDARPRIPAAGAPRGDWGVALLTRLRVLAEARIDLGQLPLDPVRRAALRLDLDVGGHQLVMVGTHLSHLTHGSLIQLLRLRAALPGADQAAVLGGDMNMWGPVVTAFLPGWRRAVRGRTWPAQLPHSQIDHLMVTPAVEVLGGGRLPRTASDHRPLRAELRLT